MAYVRELSNDSKLCDRSKPVRCSAWLADGSSLMRPSERMRKTSAASRRSMLEECSSTWSLE